MLDICIVRWQNAADWRRIRRLAWTPVGLIARAKRSPTTPSESRTKRQRSRRIWRDQCDRFVPAFSEAACRPRRTAPVWLRRPRRRTTPCPEIWLCLPEYPGFVRRGSHSHAMYRALRDVLLVDYPVSPVAAPPRQVHTTVPGLLG